jgi:type II secretory pathway component PulK
MRQRRSGMILIVAMVLIFALAGMVLALARSTRAEMLASANLAASVQADAVERGGEQYVLGMLASEGETGIRDVAEDQFAAVPVGDGYFWVIRPNYDDAQLPAFGLVDEAAKLNINSASYDQISLLPGMTYTAASSFMDWIDDDNNVERDGAENDYYLALRAPFEPYYCKNAPVETIEEVLMVRGWTREMLYGDGTSPPLGQRSSSVVNSSSLVTDPQIARGLYDLLTIYSSEPNTPAAGGQRVNLRDRSTSGRNRLRNLLTQRLDASRADAIVNTLGRTRPSDIFDFYFQVKLTPDELDKIADDLTTTTDQTLRGRVNINTAPRDVLMCLPNLNSDDVDKLINARPSPDTIGADQTSLGWVITALGEKARGLGTSITTRSLQYSADIVAVSGNGRAFKRCRIVIDISSGTPVVRYRRDISDRGWPMDKSILAAIRAGQKPNQYAASGMNQLGGGI